MKEFISKYIEKNLIVKYSLDIYVYQYLRLDKSIGYTINGFVKHMSFAQFLEFKLSPLNSGDTHSISVYSVQPNSAIEEPSEPLMAHQVRYLTINR